MTNNEYIYILDTGNSANLKGVSKMENPKTIEETFNEYGADGHVTMPGLALALVNLSLCNSVTLVTPPTPKRVYTTNAVILFCEARDKLLKSAGVNLEKDEEKDEVASVRAQFVGIHGSSAVRETRKAIRTAELLWDNSPEIYLKDPENSGQMRRGSLDPEMRVPLRDFEMATLVRETGGYGRRLLNLISGLENPGPGNYYARSSGTMPDLIIHDPSSESKWDKAVREAYNDPKRAVTGLIESEAAFFSGLLQYQLEPTNTSLSNLPY